MRSSVVLSLILLAHSARADQIPIVTLTELGPDQEIPARRSFYITGEASPTVENVQAVVVRKGSPSSFGDDGSDCRELVPGLKLDAVGALSPDDDDETDDEDLPIVPPRFPAGMHRAFELFQHASGEWRDSEVLVTAAWKRRGDDARQYKVLVPHDRDFFAPGYAYCMFVVSTQRAQEVDDTTIGALVDGIARRIVACGDKSSCDDDALADYELRAQKEVAASRSLAMADAKLLTARIKEAARSELTSSTGIIAARDHVEERWHDQTSVMKPIAPVVWAETANDPFAHALATMLARSAALLPQVRGDRQGTAVSLYTTDGRLQVRALQILDDGRSIRVASSKTPSGDQARVVTATTDALAVADGVTLYDLIQLGQGRIHVDKDWTTFAGLGDRLRGLGLDSWTSEDAAYLAAATAQMKRVADFVDTVTSGASCGQHGLATTEAEQTLDAVRKHLGEWLVCQHVDAHALQALVEQLDELEHEDQQWKATKDKLVARTKRIATVTTTAVEPMRVGFTSRTWAFSYITPFAGYAGVMRPGESVGLFYLGAQIHFDPNPVDDPQWRDGVTAKDLRRAIALEIALAPYGSGFGPDHRYSGPGNLPPLLFGVALHPLPYTSLTFGGAVLARRNSTLPQEQPRTVFSPYIGVSVQLNLPDLIRSAAEPGSETTATR